MNFAKSRFQPGKGPSRGLFHDCTTSPINRLQHYLMSSLATFSQKMRIFLPPSAGAVTSLMSMICSSFLALASKMLVEHTGSRATWNLPGCLGSSKKAWNKQHAKIKIQLYDFTWKHSLTAFKSMEEGLSMCLKPALKGSTRMSRLCFSDSSISFFLTHWMPRC